MPKHLVLIAEDDVDAREALRIMLESEGYEVLGAEDSLLAYGMLSSVRPDVIVTDIVMPNVDGVGLIRWIRNEPAFSSIPIIAMTAHGESYLRLAREAGATLTMQKPDGILELPKLILMALAKNQHVNG